MSLKAFHIFFIALSALMLFGIGIWCLRQMMVIGPELMVVSGVASFVAGTALIVYGFRFLRKFRNVSYL